MKVTRLRKLRIEKGLSLQKVADEIGVQLSLLSCVELLKKNPSLRTYRKLEKFYDCKEDLLEIVEMPDGVAVNISTKSLEDIFENQ